ncbi:uncharacterized protein LOC132047635 [Lycium ferocissimum]|uniref:uncharacterized protein LOC132047635 n=1 Tax=Lycium ferocissimum TaxID=112874 RepID=UPI0028149B50|nr:uncharacterized protein LOC132047635 [Lycium ferocissimum]
MVHWEFIQEMMEGYGFPPKFTQLIMTCITTTRFFVKVNGEGYGYFEGKKGLRQGDLISPLPFVLVMKYLTRVLKLMSQLPDFLFHPICKKQKLTHLIFADDLMIFCKGKENPVKRIMEAIGHFLAAIELVANSDKSILYVAGINDAIQSRLLEITGCKYMDGNADATGWDKRMFAMVMTEALEQVQKRDGGCSSWSNDLLDLAIKELEDIQRLQCTEGLHYTTNTIHSKGKNVNV